MGWIKDKSHPTKTIYTMDDGTKVVLDTSAPAGEQLWMIYPKELVTATEEWIDAKLGLAEV